MTTVAPNPPSPYADADPATRHLFAVPAFLNNPLRPGTLYATACNRLAVVPETPVEVTDPEQLPDGLCPICVTAMRAGAPLEDSRPTRACPQCDGTTRHDGLCAVCRMDEHDAWREAQGGVQR